MNTLSLIIGIYGIFIILIGLVAVFYNPSTATYGYNPKAKSAIISGGICGGLSLFWAYLLSSGQDWGTMGAVITTGLFLVAFSWRGSKTWKAYMNGDATKFFPATLITLMTLASSLLLVGIIFLQKVAKA